MTEAEFRIPEVNIRAAVTLIKRIQERLDKNDRTPAKIGSIYNFTGRENVSDVGARIQKAFDKTLWEKWDDLLYFWLLTAECVPMVLRLVKIYLVLSTLVVAAFFGVVIHAHLDHNPQAEYCDYNVERHEANYVSQGEPCRIRLMVVSLQFGLPFLVVTAALHSPAYLYFLVRRVRKRRAKPSG